MITPQTIQRAKQKAEKIKEDQSDAPIINVVLSLEQIEEKERAVLEEIERRKQIQEVEVAKVIEVKDKLVDEEGFLAAKQLVDEKAPFLKLNGAFGKISSGIWKDLSGVPRKIVEMWLKLEPYEKLVSIVWLITFPFCFYYAVFVLNLWGGNSAIRKTVLFVYLIINSFVFSYTFTFFLKLLFDRYVDKK